MLRIGLEHLIHSAYGNYNNVIFIVLLEWCWPPFYLSEGKVHIKFFVVLV